jgi:hypothetical protein
MSLPNMPKFSAMNQNQNVDLNAVQNFDKRSCEYKSDYKIQDFLIHNIKSIL